MTSANHAPLTARADSGAVRDRKKPVGEMAKIRHVRLAPWPSATKVPTMPWSSFGRTTRPLENSSEARFTVASSASSSAMRALAARSAEDSAVLVPASSPRSIRSWRTQRKTVAGDTATAAATSATGRPALTCSMTMALNCEA